MRKFLINASNLHVGGGIQVATSFLYEIGHFQRSMKDLSVLASKEVDEALNSLDADTNIFINYEVHDVYGSVLTSDKNHHQLDLFDAVFTIFGPLYIWRTSFKSIVGFAQPWIIYPDNECYKMLPLIMRLKIRMKYLIQSMFFKRADILVVELEHVKQQLVSVLKIPANRIHVVHNCISSIYSDPSIWKSVDVPRPDGYLRLGYLGRNYLHKNTRIFPQIVSTLDRTYGIKAFFYVTFTEQEWDECTPEFREVCFNVGVLSVVQCPKFYQAMDAIVFPSLLECFSATPLEAMAMERPIFVSDRPFNRDICGCHAHYFDPLSPDTAAAAIANLFHDINSHLNALRKGREYAINYSNPKERAEKYLALLTDSMSI